MRIVTTTELAQLAEPEPRDWYRERDAELERQAAKAIGLNPSHLAQRLDTAEAA